MLGLKLNHVSKRGHCRLSSRWNSFKDQVAVHLSTNIQSSSQWLKQNKRVPLGTSPSDCRYSTCAWDVIYVMYMLKVLIMKSTPRLSQFDCLIYTHTCIYEIIGMIFNSHPYCWPHVFHECHTWLCKTIKTLWGRLFPWGNSTIITIIILGIRMGTSDNWTLIYRPRVCCKIQSLKTRRQQKCHNVCFLFVASPVIV